MFEPDVFDDVWNTIIENNLNTVLCCKLSEYDGINHKYIRHMDKNDTWLHGKFFNREFINKYDIDFKENLESHEDVYFNSNAIKNIIEHNGGNNISLQVFSIFDVTKVHPFPIAPLELSEGLPVFFVTAECVNFFHP